MQSGRPYANTDNERAPSLDFAKLDKSARMGINKTIDVNDRNSLSKQDYSIYNIGISSKHQLRYGRKHKQDIPFADKNIDQLGSILSGDEPSELKYSGANRPITNKSTLGVDANRINSQSSVKNSRSVNRNVMKTNPNEG